MFRMEYTPGSGDEGPGGRIKINTLIDICQRCSGFQIDSCEVSQEFYERCDATTFVLFRQMDIKKYPVYGQPLVIETGVVEKKKTYGLRNTMIYDRDTGEVMIATQAGGAYVNRKTGKPEAMPKDLLERLPEYEKYEDMEYLSRKIIEPKDVDGEKLTPFPVYRYMIDSNHHVNNGRYIDVAMEYIPDDFEPFRLRIAYMSPAKYGDILMPVRYIYDDKVLISLKSEENETYANIEFTKKDGQ